MITSVLAALAYLGALFWGAVALLWWMAHRRVPRISLGLAGASLLLAVACTVVTPPGYSEAEARHIERIHAEFAPVLEAYRRRHGAYPPTLEAAGIATPRTRYGPLRYSAKRDSAGAPEYTVSFGDYNANGFTTWWSTGSKSGDWHVDS